MRTGYFAVNVRVQFIRELWVKCELQKFGFNNCVHYQLHVAIIILCDSGDATEITLRDLKPATEYHLK